MDEAAQDALFAEVVHRMLRMRRELPHADFDELAGAMLMDIDIAEMEAAGRSKPRRPSQDRTGTVVPFPGPASRKCQEPHRPPRPAAPVEEE